MEAWEKHISSRKKRLWILNMKPLLITCSLHYQRRKLDQIKDFHLDSNLNDALSLDFCLSKTMVIIYALNE